MGIKLSFGAGAAGSESLWSIVASNLLCALLAYLQNWSLGELLWIYWCQNLVIGLVNVRRMLCLKEFSTKGFTSNGKRVPETPAGKRQTAFFFLVHYGFFHAVYSAFLFTEFSPREFSDAGTTWVVVAVALFAVSHVWNFERGRAQEFAGRKPNLGHIMFYPYLRILPMHLFIVGGAILGAGSELVVFILLKTGADVAMQAVENRLLRGKRSRSEQIAANRKRFLSRMLARERG